MAHSAATATTGSLRRDLAVTLDLAAQLSRDPAGSLWWTRGAQA